MRVVHANWTGGRLHVWAECASLWRTRDERGVEADAEGSVDHAFALREGKLEQLLLGIVRAGGVKAGGVKAGGVKAGGVKAGGGVALEAGSVELMLPSDERGLARASSRLSHSVGCVSSDEIASEEGGVALGRYRVPTVSVSGAVAGAVVERLREASEGVLEGDGVSRASLGFGESVGFFAVVWDLVRYLLSQQRFVPMVLQGTGGALRGSWQAWVGDEATEERVARLVRAMPGVCRSVVDGFGHQGWAVVEDFMQKTADACVRGVMVREELHEAVEGRGGKGDLHVAWLGGLLGSWDEVRAGAGERAELVKGVRRWIGGLEDRGSEAAWRLHFRVEEPLDVSGLGDLSAPGDDVVWRVQLGVQSTNRLHVVVDAEELWLLPGGAANVEGERLEGPAELLLAELGRAARVYRKLERVLEDAEPSSFELNTAEAYRFLREYRPMLEEQGFGVEVPGWWDSPTIRVGARLRIESEEMDLAQLAEGGGGRVGGQAGASVGLGSLVNYRWQIAVGETALSLEQFEKLATQQSPLVQMGGRWVEIRQDDISAAMRFLKENPGGEMSVARALRLAYGSEGEQSGLAILGMEATGWVKQVFGSSGVDERVPMLTEPEGFVGKLRPYQQKGLSWMAFLDRLGLGACLADDMGLGKTVQLLALLAWERAWARERGEEGVVGPTLLVVPMSVVANWVHETRRFTPGLRVLVHHGGDRSLGESLVRRAQESDLVLTTYALAHRDSEELSRVDWWRVVLDEAQNIKNPGAKQTMAVRSVDAPKRIALTGTPVENRLGELWSIMEFLNPGYLGPAPEFRKKFAVPIERYHDKQKGEKLRGLVQPFMLRRLKSDPAVIADLPEKVETKEYCYLTPEQAQLYQTCVNDMLGAADRAEGIQRRGLVLAGLIKLKQICNHPGHFLKDWGEDGMLVQEGGAPDTTRGGKTQRIAEMLEEVVAAGDRALVFTQFRRMGHGLASMLRHVLDREVLFLHGGTSAQAREKMVRRFQEGAEKGDGPPIFILSLKAGGVGLNLTAANHVFHFDRWWNPAVEAQATDRAYRIGQTRTVQVHKFVVSGTLEERIDQMIEEKTELAEQVVGSGERWLTELSTNQLRDLLRLRVDTVDTQEAGEVVAAAGGGD